MPVAVGILLDVSGSMAETVNIVPRSQRRQTESWVHSIFRVAEDLIKYDVSYCNRVFVLGVGALIGPPVFDLLNTLKRAENQPDISNAAEKYLSDDEWSLTSLVRRALLIVENNGAPNVRGWASTDLIEQVARKSDAAFIVAALENDSLFRNVFVHEYLPGACRKEPPKSLLGKAAQGTQQKCMPEVATKRQVKDIIDKASRSLRDNICDVYCQWSLFKARQALDILKGCSEPRMSEDRVDDLLEEVRPYIFGDTPLNHALKKAVNIYSVVSGFRNVLFVLSDGMPNDKKLPPKDKLNKQDVTVISCYITRRHLDDARRLYCRARDDWDEPTRYMYNLSSTISTQTIPRTIFVKKHWHVEFYNNETRLFLQVNNPDVMEDVCQFARDVVCSQEALSDVLSTVSLDQLINKANDGLRPPHQDGPTCYANAVASVVYMATRRIYGRHGGYPDFFKIRARIIKEFTSQRSPTRKGADTSKVLRKVLFRDYRLRYENVDILGALEAVSAKRPVVARFRLTDPEWEVFREFYRRKPRQILTKAILDTRKRKKDEKTSGHAVVFTSYNCRSLRFMNSWGSQWGDGGFFEVESAAVLNVEFFDVYFNEEDLYGKERLAYKDSGAQVAEDLYERLRCLKDAKYRCPFCGRVSAVSEYYGNATLAVCPKCRVDFDPQAEKAHDVAMSLYLLSLCRKSRDE